jgi:hypothetical protein
MPKAPSQLALALISSGHAKDLNEANKIIGQMSNSVHFEGSDPEELLLEYGLEADYVFDVLYID